MKKCPNCGGPVTKIIDHIISLTIGNSQVKRFKCFTQDETWAYFESSESKDNTLQKLPKGLSIGE